MLQAILELFTTTQKAQAMLDIPIIKTIFIILFSLFIITCLTHMITFFKIKSIRNYVKQTKRLDINLLNIIKLVQMTISVFILLGVLGTFIGLTISLGSISANSDQLIENVSAILSGIDVAFYTSIVGMGFSLVMTILTRVFNTEYLLNDL